MRKIIGKWIDMRMNAGHNNGKGEEHDIDDGDDNGNRNKIQQPDCPPAMVCPKG